MTILVTGAAGFVGGHLLKLVDRRGDAIVGWYRDQAHRQHLPREVRSMQVDLLDRDVVQRAVAEIEPDAVYHLAGWAHVAQSWQHTFETYQTNVLGTEHLLSAIRRSAPQARVLVACSGAIYRPQNRPLSEDDPIAPASPYATSKLAQEMLCERAWRDDRVHTVIARSFNHTGPGQDSSYVASGIARQIARIEAGLQEPILRLGNLEPIRDLTDVRDVARAYVAMMDKASIGRPYNVCSGRHLSIRTLVETFLSRSRREVSIVQDPALFRPNDLPMLVGDHTRLTAETGWRPEVSLEQTVDDLLTFWREQIRV